MEIRQSKIYYAYVEGKQEKMYLKHFEALINSCEKRKYNVKINVKDAKGGSPMSIVKVAVNNRELQMDAKLKNVKTAIFDYDQKESEFIESVKTCEKSKIFPAYSIVNFDLWILMHKKEFNRKVKSNIEYKKEIIKEYGLDKNTDIKAQSTIDKILKQINLDDVFLAIKRAKRIESTNKNDRNIMCNNPLIFNQPNLEIYKFFESIISEVGLIKR